MMVRRDLCTAALALLTALPATAVRAEGATPYDLAISRLRACVTSGSAGAPRESLKAAMVAVASLCRPQLDRAYAASDEQVEAEHPQASGDRLEALQRQARQRIDRQVLVLISHQTGMSS